MCIVLNPCHVTLFGPEKKQKVIFVQLCLLSSIANLFADLILQVATLPNRGRAT